MKELDSILSLYKPVQPTIRLSEKSVTYQEYAPHQLLHGIIYCYWQLKTTEALESDFNYRVVADGCIDVFFEASAPSQSFVMGFCQKYTEFQLEKSFNYIGVRFLPSMFPQLFRVNARELSNRYESLKVVNTEFAEFIDQQPWNSLSLEDSAHLLNQFFENHLANVEFDTDPRFYEALQLILKNRGTGEIEKELQTGVSPRQLRRIFNYYIGTTPKTFSKVVRFQTILNAKPSTQSLKLNKIFYDIGYYDQAHFIKDFKKLYGVTPSRAFR